MDSNLSDEERSRAIKFCKEYLNGAWKTASNDKIIVTRLSGGLTNLLFHCVLDDSAVVDAPDGKANEPRQVLLRIYGDSDQSDIATQIRIFNKLAEKHLGPKLYSTFPEGRFEEYLPSGPLTLEEMMDEAISKTIARKFALIHSLDISALSNQEAETNGWILNKCNRYNDFIVSARNDSIKFNNNVPEATRIMANELMSINFKKEIDYLGELMKNSDEPLVFCHNDLHHNNILLLHDTKLPLNDRVVLIDFENYSYNYRSFDLANHLSEWCFNYSGDRYPYFDASIDRFPSETRQKAFIAEYLIESRRNREQNSRPIVNNNLDLGLTDEFKLNKAADEIYQKMQPFHMASNFLWCVWAIVFAHNSAIDFGYWEMAKHKWDIYECLKQRYMQSNGNNSYIADSDTDKSLAGLQAARM